MNYGDRLKRLREDKKLSQQQLADRLNINRSTYARYELAQTQPDYDTLKKIADFFQVSIDYLLGRTDEPDISKMDKLKKIGLKEDEEIHFFDMEGLSDEDIEFIKQQIEFLRKKAKQLRKDN
jgi:transcriptional regulator with XRE-family HTH domain